MKDKMPSSIKIFLREQFDYEKKELKKPPGERNLYPNGTDANLVINCLWDVFFPGDHIVAPIGGKQFNTFFLNRMLMRYYRPYSKAVRKWRKQHEH